MIGLILAAGGAGSRFGSPVPKQFLALEGVPVYLRALTAFLPYVAEAVVVVPGAWRERVTMEVSSCAGQVSVEIGGDERQESVWKGLQRLSPDVKTVLVHDAARPYVSAALIERVLAEVRSAGACIPGLPVRETVKEIETARVLKTLDRSRLVLVQTPQAFDRGLLVRAFESAIQDDVHVTDESSLVERLGVSVTVVAGEPGNIKITWKQDLESR